MRSSGNQIQMVTDRRWNKLCEDYDYLDGYFVFEIHIIIVIATVMPMIKDQ